MHNNREPDAQPGDTDVVADSQPTNAIPANTIPANAAIPVSAPADAVAQAGKKDAPEAHQPEQEPVEDPPAGSVVRGFRGSPSDVGGEFRIVTARYFMNGEEIVVRGKPHANTTLELNAHEGVNTFEVHDSVQGINHFPVMYLSHYTFDAKNKATFHAHSNDHVSVSVTTTDNRSLLKEMKDRFDIHIATDVKPAG